MSWKWMFRHTCQGRYLHRYLTTLAISCLDYLSKMEISSIRGCKIQLPKVTPQWRVPKLLKYGDLCEIRCKIHILDCYPSCTAGGICCFSFMPSDTTFMSEICRALIVNTDSWGSIFLYCSYWMSKNQQLMLSMIYTTWLVLMVVLTDLLLR